MRQGGRERLPFPKQGKVDLTLTLTLDAVSLAMGFSHVFSWGPKTTQKREAVKVAILRKTSKDLSLALIVGHDSKKI